jgi:hypothetical protein
MGHPRINGHFCGWDTPQKCHFTLGFCILNFSIAGCPCATCSYIQVSTVASLVAHKNPTMISLVPWLSVAVLEMGTGSSPELGTVLP